MRKAVARAWEEAVRIGVATALPGYAPYDRRERGEPRGLIRYARVARPGLTCFIAFRPLDSEAFDAWVGWSTHGACPLAMDRSQGPDDFSAPHAMASSADLVPRSGAIHWNFWIEGDALADDPVAFAQAYARHFNRELTADEARALVEPAVVLALAEVLGHGLPYLERRIAHAA